MVIDVPTIEDDLKLFSKQHFGPAFSVFKITSYLVLLCLAILQQFIFGEWFKMT